jgi:hypothetical protein
MLLNMAFLIIIKITAADKTVGVQLLRNMAFLHISNCTAVDITCCSSVITQYGVSTHQSIYCR